MPSAPRTPCSTDDDGEVCLHREIEPYDDDPSRGVCIDCGDDFGIRVAPPIDAESDDLAAEEEPSGGAVAADAVAVG